MPEDPSPALLRTVTSTALLDGLRQRDNETLWSQFVERYRPMIARYAQRMGLRPDDAEDAAQATMIAFCEAYRAGQYERQQGRLRGWLFGIARNQIRSARKRGHRRERQVHPDSAQTDFFARIEEDEDQLERIWEEEWRSAIINECLNVVRGEVDAKTLEAFELFAWKGWPAQKVANELGMSPNAVFIAKHRILKRIRELVPNMEEIW